MADEKTLRREFQQMQDLCDYWACRAADAAIAREDTMAREARANYRECRRAAAVLQRAWEDAHRRSQWLRRRWQDASGGQEPLMAITRQRSAD
ncbi:MAG: hypothetical protein HUU20_01000 [Pirellulales bacterium]|nr:hypothetical protein [Pirellulales bacterium]